MVKFISNSFSTTLNVVKKGTVVTLCMVLVGLFFAVGCKKTTNSTDPEIIGNIKVIPENISIYDSILFVTFASPFSGSCTQQLNVDSIIDTKIYISGKYNSNNKCGAEWDKKVNDTINVGLFPAGVYEIIYTFIDINQYGAMYPTEIHRIKFFVSPLEDK